ncbi:MAG: ATP synthase F1 subunit gamma [Sarcina sp.]
MPAAGLLVIKRRMNSVRNTQKITKAMALVSTAKVKKARDKLSKNNIYFRKLEMMKKDIFMFAEDFKDNEFIQPNGSDKKLYVVFTSNSGFCGGFNGSGAIYLNEKFASKEEKAKIDTYVLGRKGVSYLNKYGISASHRDTSIKGDIDIKTSRRIVGKIMNMYLNKDYGEISFLYTKFKSPIEQELVEVPVLPFKIEKTEEESKINIFNREIHSDELIESFIYRYIEGLLINATYSAMASEENARMQAMDGATRNAGDIIDNLNTKYNRIRQAAITQEISEIVGGAESQK